MKAVILAVLLAAWPLIPAVAGEPSVQMLKVGPKHNIEATLYTPDGPGPFPSILLMGTSGGVKQYDQEYCARLAREGFVCIVPKYLEANGIKWEVRRISFSSDAREITGEFIEIISELNRMPNLR